MSLASILKRMFNKKGKNKKIEDENNAPKDFPELKKSLDETLALFKKELGSSADVKYHEFSFGENSEFSAALVYIDGLVDNQTVSESIIKPLILTKNINKESPKIKSMESIKKTILFSNDAVVEENMEKLIYGCLSGDTVLLVDGFSEGVVITTRSWDKRSVSEPQTESVVRGPREGFTENFRTNTSLIRRKIKSPLLRMEHMVIGRKTGTNICLAYIKDVAKPEVIDSVKKRLEALEIDSVLDTSYLEEYIEDAPFSIFATTGYSEKPDVIASKILEGRVAIISDGSPFVLTAPLLFIESFQSAEDYYVRPFYASITRLLRFLAYFIAIFAVPIFIALTIFHQEFIPTTLLLTIASAREGTPFPAIFEALIMVVSFEILKEAGLRLPRPVGQAISIVGALVMGEAAVSAGLVGAPMVITVAIAAVAGFIVPDQADSIMIFRVIMMILASILGGFGLALGFIMLLVHLSTIKSYTVPYFDSVIPSRDQQDTFVRMPLWIMGKRPIETSYKDVKRRDVFVPPVETNEKQQNEKKEDRDENKKQN